MKRPLEIPNWNTGMAAVWKLLVLVLLLARCVSPLAPPDARPAFVPAHYAELWARAERCTGVTGDLARVSWYVVEPDEPNGGFDCPWGSCNAVWFPAHSIYLSSLLTTDEGVVVHEMMHDLLQDGSHRHSAFRQVCR